jgi:type IV secretory pathway VirB2 component (pilin)
MKYLSKPRITTICALYLTLLGFPQAALAQAMPWESPLRQLLNSFQTTTAQILIIMAIIAAALAFAFGEAGSVFRRAAGIVFGGAIAVGASTWAPALFGF